VIVAIDRAGTSALLDAFGVRYWSTGIAIVDDAMRTNRANVFAAGELHVYAGAGSDANGVSRPRSAARSRARPASTVFLRGVTA